MLKRPGSTIAFAAALFMFAVSAVLHPVLADDQSGRTLVGSWTVVITSDLAPVPMVDLTTVNRDGTMINTDAQFGTGHGVWKRLGASRFAIKFMTPIMLTAPMAPPGSMLTVEGTVMVDGDGGTASGLYQATVVDAFGNLLFPFTGSIKFQRITIAGEDD